MSETQRDFKPERGWVVVSGRVAETGKRYAFLDTFSPLRKQAIMAYLQAEYMGDDYADARAWRREKNRQGVAVVRCRLVPEVDDE